MVTSGCPETKSGTNGIVHIVTKCDSTIVYGSDFQIGWTSIVFRYVVIM